MNKIHCLMLGSFFGGVGFGLITIGIWLKYNKTHYIINPLVGETPQCSLCQIKLELLPK